MKNVEIREKANKNRVYMYEIAEMLNMQDSNFSRLLRKELPEEDKQKILQVIEQIINQRS